MLSMASSMEDRLPPETCFRLPKTVIPHLYHLRMKVDLENFTFHGQEIVEIDVKQETKEIILNAVELKIISAKFKCIDGKARHQFVDANKIHLCEKSEVAIIQFSSTLNLGTGQLKLEFNGTLNNKVKGFYRSNYINAEGEERFVASTLFQPTNARRAFPCWDEPEFKAKFHITLIVPADKVALSNTNVISQQPFRENKDFKVVEYSITPLMSTYLLAFVVGDYDYVQDKTNNGVAVRVYTPVGKKKEGAFSLSVAMKALKFFEEYFKISYPLPKLDLISLPAFSVGAMENWGLITFLESYLHIIHRVTSTRGRQETALVVAHEISHQWFGNLVTMKWWTYLWLNEGFAMFMQFFCINELFANWNVWLKMITDIINPTLDFDALSNSHPLEVPVCHPSEIDEIFDPISYNKGASLLRMIHNYIGNEHFKEGLQLYLKKYSYSNTVSKDLWKAFEEVSQQPIENIMTKWTKQKGFPLITVSSRQEGSNRIVILSQKKFTANGKLDEEDKKAFWLIPVTIRIQIPSGNDDKRILLSDETTEVILTDVSINQLVIVNPERFGFYRVNYECRLLNQLKIAIREKSLKPSDRLCIQNDVFALVKAGKVSTVKLLEMLEAFVDEENFSVWNSISVCANELYYLLSSTDCVELFLAYARNLFSRIHSKLGWDHRANESNILTLTLVIESLILLRDPLVLEEALTRYEALSNRVTMISDEITALIYDAAISNGYVNLFRTLFNDEIPIQDSYNIISRLVLNPIAHEPLWHFFQDNFHQFKNRFENLPLMSRVVRIVCYYFASEQKANEVEAFFSNNPIVGVELGLKQAIEGIRLKGDWLKRDLAAIKSFLLNRSTSR
ncbi:Puromycin-sensitive aminopeptidase-like protein [Dinothrombium tinctorium]|uniref:Aminopeptidase n=1 Tax=Dinothrombium tinctorium TaxID=1965070 RepID=A0A3S3QNF7_9ACAR|nr:Puromycin-sensitive aminopeptidase-like protein [Dinothrombium tinctorium]